MIKDYCGSLYGNYRTPKFTDIYDSAESFIADYQDIGIPATIPVESDESTGGCMTTLFYLLYSRYGNSVIASSDTTRFKYKLFSIIWQYGPDWVKKLDIQNKLRSLSDTEMLDGSVQIYNDASNPSTQPDTNSDQILTYIDKQNVSINKRDKLAAYAALSGLLKTDVTDSFLSKFKSLFLMVAQPEEPLYYITEEDSENE